MGVGGTVQPRTPVRTPPASGRSGHLAVALVAGLVLDVVSLSRALRTGLVVGIAGSSIGLLVTLAVLGRVLRTRGPVAWRTSDDDALTGSGKA